MWGFINIWQKIKITHFIVTPVATPIKTVNNNPDILFLKNKLWHNKGNTAAVSYLSEQDNKGYQGEKHKDMKRPLIF
jgi:hypothetical protein